MRIVYSVSQIDMFGYVKANSPLEKKEEQYECLEADALLKTYT
jgi:hypothetical protein